MALLGSFSLLSLLLGAIGLGTVVGVHTTSMSQDRSGIFEGNSLYPLAPSDYRPAIVSGRTQHVVTLTRTGDNATYGPITFVDPEGTSRSVTLTVTTGSTTANSASAALQLGRLSYITSYYHVTTSGAVVTLRAKVATVAGTSFADTDGNLTTAESTADAAGTNLQVGRLVIDNGMGGNQGTQTSWLGQYALSGTFTAQVVAYDFSGVTTGDVVETTISIPGYADENGTPATISVSTPYVTSQAQTLDNHIAALNAQLDQIYGAGQSVVAARSTAKFTLTSEITGLAFHAIVTVGGGRTGTATIDASTSAPSTGIGVGNRTYDHLTRLLGVVERGSGAKESSVGAGDCVYEPGRAFLAIRQSEGVCMKNADGVTLGQRGWLSISSATYGQVFNAASTTTRLPLPLSKFRWLKDKGNGTAIAAINL